MLVLNKTVIRTYFVKFISAVSKLFQKKRALRSKKDVVDSLRPLKLLYNIKHFNGT